MTDSDSAVRKRNRLTFEVDSPFLSRLRRAASKQHMTIRQDVLAAVEDRLREERQEGYVVQPSALTAKTDPALAELWDNPLDGAYDRLSAGRCGTR